MRYGMVIDLFKCMGCHACVVACRAEHGTPPGVLYNRVEQMDVGRYPNARPVFAPMACRHCQDPDCVKACPTEASYQRDDGIVLVDPDKCIGCQACVPACPYGARSLVRELNCYYPGQSPTPYEQNVTRRHEPGKVEKCDFCHSRVEQGKRPACVDTCPAQARYFGDLDDPDSPPSRQLSLHEAVKEAAEPDARLSLIYIRSREECGR